MNQLEQNIVNSFRLAKSDIINLQKEVIRLSQTQERIIEMLNRLNVNEVKLYNQVKKSKTAKVVKKKKPVKKAVKKVKPKAKPKPKVRTIVKTVTKRANKVYVATKDGKKFHVDSCPFAQNIKPMNKQKFKSKTKALNEGFKACKCVK